MTTTTPKLIRQSSAIGINEGLTKTVSRKVTETNGGPELWVVAPDHQGWIIKRGFRWRKLWKRRWMVMKGREIMYLCDSVPSDVDVNPSLVLFSKRLNPFSKIDDNPNPNNQLEFTIYPHFNNDHKYDDDDLPWRLRAMNIEDKIIWLKKLHHCLDIIRWLQHYKFGRVLGIGGNGIVREVIDHRTNEKAAMKEIIIKDKSYRQVAVAEVEILKNVTEYVKHPNLIQIRKVYEEGNKFFIVLGLCTGGELYDRIVSKRHYCEKDAAEVMFKIISALDALHSHNILHLDIKPENILYETELENSEIKITDFGLARILSSEENEYNMLSYSQSNLFNSDGKDRLCGTVGYMSPEIIVSRRYGPSADIWAAGVILYILCVGYPPFYGDTTNEILTKSSRGEYSMDENDWSEISDEAKNLIRRMLTVDARERITAKGVLQHEWFSYVLHNQNNINTLTNTQSRMERYNTTRHTLKMSLQLERTLRSLNATGLSTNFGGFKSNLSAEAALSFMQTSEIQSKIRELFNIVSPKTGSLSFQQFIVLANYLKASHLSPIATFQFFDHDHDGAVSADDFFQTHNEIANMSDTYIRFIFVLYATNMSSTAKKLSVSVTKWIHEYASYALIKHINSTISPLLPSPKYITITHIRSVFIERGINNEIIEELCNQIIQFIITDKQENQIDYVTEDKNEPISYSIENSHNILDSFDNIKPEDEFVQSQRKQSKGSNSHNESNNSSNSNMLHKISFRLFVKLIKTFPILVESLLQSPREQLVSSLRQTTEFLADAVLHDPHACSLFCRKSSSISYNTK